MPELFRTCTRPRTVSPSLHSCPASGGASSFLQASALSLHEALRPPGAEDARCVQPTSATRTNDVHPFAVRSRLDSNPFRNPGRPAVVRGYRASMTEETGVFTTPEPLRSHLPCGLRTRSSCLRPRGFRSRAWACWTRGARWDEISDTSVATSSSSSRSRTFVRAR